MKRERQGEEDEEREERIIIREGERSSHRRAAEPQQPWS